MNELDAADLRRHQLLGGLLDQWTVTQITTACVEALGFPYQMVGTVSEATKVLAYMQKKWS